MGDAPRAKSVVDIYRGDSCGAAVEHGQQSGDPVEGGPVTDTGGNSDDGFVPVD